MFGHVVMSRATKCKHVIKEVWLDNLELPSKNQQVVRIVASRGNNLHEVEDANKAQFLVSMPTKFRKNVWIKRGDFVLVDPITEGDKVKGEIVSILTLEHVRYFKENKCWPKEFEENHHERPSDELFVNTNRPLPQDDTTSSSGEESDSSLGVEET
uniref:Probable RNA-binding protein EIF1AD n=1 Tax=Timema bartmani TaxID=61472 RepID=A0A7R9F0D7_9NEOP|nr:unnamed protein product [Timema bartmani]